MSAYVKYFSISMHNFLKGLFKNIIYEKKKEINLLKVLGK